jgi:hypothetical protein
MALAVTKVEAPTKARDFSIPLPFIDSLLGVCLTLKIKNL